MSIENLLHPLLRHYFEAPGWMKAPAAARAYAWLPRVIRWGSAYDAFREEISSSQDAAAAERLALQKLGEVLRWAIQTVPAYRPYRALLARHDEPRQLLARLPVTDKMDIKRHLVLSSDHLEERHMPRYAEALVRHRPAFIEAFRSALYPLARRLAAMVEDPAAINQVYKIAVNAKTNLNELFEMIRSLLEPRYPRLRDLRPLYREFRAGDVRTSQADVSKAERLFAYRPAWRVGLGLARAVEWYAAKLSPARSIDGRVLGLEAASHGS